MKKKIITFILTISMLITLVSCENIFNSSDDTEAELKLINTEISQLAENCLPSCIGISNYSGNSIGSAVIIKKEDRYTYALTNRHVIESEVASPKLNAYFGNGLSVNATLVAQSSVDTDLAVVKFIAPINRNLKIVTFANDILVKGQGVLAIGCPISLDYYNTTTTGIISNIHLGLIQHTAAINPGNSGGALFDLAGNLIGINTSKIVDQEKMGFAINMKKVKEFLASKSIMG